MESLKVDFINGAISNGCPDYEAETIWHKIETAGKYSLNRSQRRSLCPDRLRWRMAQSKLSDRILHGSTPMG